MDEHAEHGLDDLTIITMIVTNLLHDWDRFPSLQAVSPHVALLRRWRDNLRIRLEAEQHGDSVP